MGFFKRKKQQLTRSGLDAKSRLKLVLYSEHQGLPPETIEQIKADIISVITKYVDVDIDNFDIKISPDGKNSGSNGPALQANIPIREKEFRRY